MDKNNRKLIFLALLGGIVYWVADSIWEKFIHFPDVSFWSILFYPAVINDVDRPAVILLIAIFVSVIFIINKNRDIKERHYRQLLDNINDAVFITSLINYDGTDKFVEINEVACELLGYSREQLLQLSPQDIIDPENRGDLSTLTGRLKTEGRALSQTVLVAKDGGMVPVEVNAKILQFKGESICLAVVRDITLIRNAEQALRESEQQVRLVTTKLFKAQEEERGRISKELHDELGQSLMFLKMEVSDIQSRLPKFCVDLHRECEKLLAYLEETADNARRLSRDLKPQLLEKRGFSLAVNFLIKESCELYGIKSCVIDQDRIDELLSPAAQLNLYRIFQESLTNIGKHSRATEVSALIKKQADQIFIRIQDNGRGYDLHKTAVEKVGLGLSTMAERARLIGGKLTIQSQPGKGTEIILNIPLAKLPQLIGEEQTS